MQAPTPALPTGESDIVGQSEQVVTCVAPAADEYLPATQLVQSTVPIVFLYFPATQLVHGPPFGPVKPALQMQAVEDELPAGVSE